MDFRREVLELLRSGDAHEMGHAARAELQPHHRRVQSEVSVDFVEALMPKPTEAEVENAWSYIEDAFYPRRQKEENDG